MEFVSFSILKNVFDINFAILILFVCFLGKEEDVEVFAGNIAATQLIYNCLGAFSKVGKRLKANLMSSSTSDDGTSQTITIEIPSKYLENNLPSSSSADFNVGEDDETMDCFLQIPHEEDESVDTGGITIPAEPE